MALFVPLSNVGVTFTTLNPSKLTTIDLIGGIKCHICHLTFGNKKDFDTHYANHNSGGPNIVYTCVVCHKEIAGYPTFRNHCYSIHVIKDRYKCKDCSKTYSKQSVLQQHIDAVHKFKCATCKKPFSSKKELQMHQITHRDSPPYDCQTCKEPIETVDDCEHHVDKHCTLTYSCPVCNETILDKNKTVGHLTKHFGKVCPEPIIESDLEISEESSLDFLGGILCCFCGTTHKNRIEFDMHFVVEHGDKDIIYSCNICGKQHDKYNLFGDHCYYHYSKDRFECEECDKSFPRLSLLVLHSSACSPGAAKPFPCATCGRAYTTETRLRVHMREKHGEQAMQCNQQGCGKLFETPKDLIYHQSVHKSGNKCFQCGLQFASLSACERHVPVHRKKLYSCPVCNRSYAEKYLMMKHIPQHFTSVLHLCKVCGKIFNARNRLVEHAKTHSETRDFICSYCGKGFVKSNHLTQHLNIHTGKKPFQCAMCPKTFASYPNFHKHMRKIHNVNKVVTLDKTVEEFNGTEKDVNKELMNNNNNLVKEDFVDSTSSEMETCSEMDTYSFVGESDDSLVESDGIDPVAMEQESKLFEATNIIKEIDSIENVEHASLEELLPEDIHDAFVAAVTPSFTPPVLQPNSGPPQEYGPDFGKDSTGFIDLDDQNLPHIDPLLTIKPDMYVSDFNAYQYEYEQNDPNAYAKLEPIISKMYSEAFGFDTDVRMPVLNSDIF